MNEGIKVYYIFNLTCVLKENEECLQPCCSFGVPDEENDE